MLGWIKLHRKIVNSRMYKSLNSKQRDVLIQIMLLANHDENEWEWQGEIFKCEPGQFISSLQSIADNCASDVKVQSVRTSLLKLEKWGFLTNKSTKTGRLITIIKWHTYQMIDDESNNQNNKQPTKHQQSSNKALTTNKNVKNVKNDKEEKSRVLSPEILMKGWNDICGEEGLPKVLKLTPDRRSKVNARLRTHSTLEFWTEVLNEIPEQEFLMGKNDRKWKADFDWLMANDTNAVKVLEGKYKK